jgi:hypothetical protein
MPTTRRIIFGLLVAGCLVGLTEALGFRPSIYWLNSLLFLTGLVSPFGLLAWSMACLKTETTLTRVALGMVFVFMLALCYVIAKLPT